VAISSDPGFERTECPVQDTIEAAILPCHGRLLGAQNAHLWTASVLIGIGPTSAQNGESARGYQAIFLPLAALSSPGHGPIDGWPSVHPYIAAVEVNVLNCR